MCSYTSFANLPQETFGYPSLLPHLLDQILRAGAFAGQAEVTSIKPLLEAVSSQLF